MIIKLTAFLFPLLIAASAQADVLLPPEFNTSASRPQAREISIDYTPWLRVCGNQETCLTVKEAYLATGDFFASVAVIGDRTGNISQLRTVLPLGVDLTRGTRMRLDEEQPVGGTFSICFPNGCMAEYKADKELEAKLRTDKTLAVEAFDGVQNRPIYLVFPLSDFSSADTGPAISPDEFQAKQDEFQAKQKELAKQSQATEPKGKKSDQ